MNKRKGTTLSLAVVAGVFVVLWIICNLTPLSHIIGEVVGILVPVIAGLCIAFILNIPLSFLEKTWIKLFSEKYPRLRRAVCIILCLLFSAAAIALILGLVLPQMYTNIQTKLFPKIPDYINKVGALYGGLSAWLRSFSIELPPLDISSDAMVNAIKRYFSENAQSIVSESISIATAFASGIIDSILALVIAIYILAQKERLSARTKKAAFALLPDSKASYLVRISRMSSKTFARFVTGQIIEAFIIGALCFVGMLIFRFPYPLIISVMVGVTALIPIFGPFIGTAIGAVLILFESPMQALWFVVFIIVLQQLEGNLIYPKVVGAHVGLPALWVLVAVTIGSGFGLGGILVAVPLASLIYSIVGEIIDDRIKKKGLSEQFPKDEAPKKKKSKKRKNKNPDEEAIVEEQNTEKPE